MGELVSISTGSPPGSLCGCTVESLPPSTPRSPHGSIALLLTFLVFLLTFLVFLLTFLVFLLTFLVFLLTFLVFLLTFLVLLFTFLTPHVPRSSCSSHSSCPSSRFLCPSCSSCPSSHSSSWSLHSPPHHS